MKRTKGSKCPRPWAMMAFAASFVPAGASADPCGSASPAMPIPEYRGDVKLWHDRFRPVDPPGLPLPKDRDSTDYTSNTIPSALSGHELFQSLDVAADTLFVAYNVGLQAWRIDGEFATAPQRVAFRDGLMGHFPFHPPAGEVDGYIFELDALELSGRATVVVALAGLQPVGLTLWAYDVPSRHFRALYQQTSAEALSVALIEHDGGVYSISANGNLGMIVHDVGAALLANEPCIDEPIGTCAGVHLGAFGEVTGPRYVAVHDAPGGVLVAGSVGGALPSTPLPSLWWLPDPGAPGMAAQVATWGTKFTHNPVFIAGEKLHLAAFQDDAIVFRDVTKCLADGACGPLGAPKHVVPLASTSLLDHKLTLSRAYDRDILHHGVITLFLKGPSVEPLLDVTDLDSAPPFDILTGGQTYVDPCHGGSGIGYFADAYEGNFNGMRGSNPRRGLFHGPVFYHLSTSVIDVHAWDGPEPDDSASSGAEETGGTDGTGITTGEGTSLTGSHTGGGTTCEPTGCGLTSGSSDQASTGSGTGAASGGANLPPAGACAVDGASTPAGALGWVLLAGLLRRRRVAALRADPG